MSQIILTVEDFCEILGVTKLSDKVQDAIEIEGPLIYRSKDAVETKKIIDEIITKIENPETPEAGPNFKVNWESNWKQSLLSYENSAENSSLIPSFIPSVETLRFRGGYIEPLVPDFEMKMVRILRLYLFEKYFTQVNELHEFGAGTGFNLIHFCEIFPNKTAFGYDWSPSAVALIKKAGIQNGFKINSELFDMFNPDYGVQINENSGLLTVGAMEQLGTGWKEFLDFMLKMKFVIYINIETIYENLDSSDKYASVRNDYIRRRNWLQGYHQELDKLNREGIIELLDQRVVIGSKFHDSWSITVWKLKHV
jgi:hypothetical protein